MNQILFPARILIFQSVVYYFFIIEIMYTINIRLYFIVYTVLGIQGWIF